MGEGIAKGVLGDIVLVGEGRRSGDGGNWVLGGGVAEGVLGPNVLVGEGTRNRSGGNWVLDGGDALESCGTGVVFCAVGKGCRFALDGTRRSSDVDIVWFFCGRR